MECRKALRVNTPLLYSELVAEIRAITNHELVVGTRRFKDEVEAMTNRHARMGQPDRPSKKAKDGQ